MLIQSYHREELLAVLLVVLMTLIEAKQVLLSLYCDRECYLVRSTLPSDCPNTVLGVGSDCFWLESAGARSSTKLEHFVQER